MTQVVHNKHLAEYYLIDRDKKFTIDLLNGDWRCSCQESDCRHIRAVQGHIRETKCQKLRS